MPRGKKKKVVRLISPKGGHFIGHRYHNNHRNTDKSVVFSKMYDPVARQHVTPQVKDEKHS